MNWKKHESDSIYLGITVKKETSISYKEEENYEHKNIVVSFILLLLGAYSVMGMMITDFKTPLLSLILYSVIIFFICGFFSILFYFKKYLKYSMGTLYIIFYIVLPLLRKQLNQGLHTLYSYGAEFLNKKYHKNYILELPSMQPVSDDSIPLMLFLIIFVTCWLLAIWIVYSPNASRIVLLFCLLLVYNKFLIGTLPSIIPLCMIIFCIFGTSIQSSINKTFQKKKKKIFRSPDANSEIPEENQNYIARIQMKSTMYLGLILFVSLLGVTLISAIPTTLFYNANGSKIKNQIQQGQAVTTIRRMMDINRNPISYLFSSTAIGGIGDGTLGDVDSVTFSGKEALRIATSEKPESTLYLKAFSSDVYDDNRWTISTIETDYYKKHAPNGDNALIRQNYTYKLLSGFSEQDPYLTPALIIVQNRNASNRYMYTPYFSLQDHKYREGESTLEYYEIQGYQGALQIAGTFQDYSDVLYQQEVLPAYLQIPDSGLEQLKTKSSTFGLYGEEHVEAITDYIRYTLQNDTKYDLNIGKLPEGKEFTEYFLFEQKKGFCTHYATAATLMYRMLGIPARYVMGYSVTPDLFNSNNVASIKDERAHAWTEIYITGFGWMPVEMTPSGQMEDSLAELEQNATLSESPEESESLEKATTALADNPPSKKTVAIPTESVPKSDPPIETSASKQSEIFSYRGLLILAFFTLCFIVSIFFYWNTKLKKTQNLSSNERIKNSYAHLYKIFLFAGLSKEYHLTDREFGEFFQAKFPEISKENFCEYKNLIMEVHYGNREMTWDDIRKVKAIYNSCCLGITKKLSWSRKIVFKLFYLVRF